MNPVVYINFHASMCSMC